MHPKIHVSLVILDEESDALIDEVAAVTGAVPSVVWRKGDSKGKGGLYYQENGWELKSNLPLEAGLVDHINSILSIVIPVQDKFEILTRKYYSQLSCAIYFSDDMPELYLAPSLLKQIANLNVALDLDLYSTI